MNLQAARLTEDAPALNRVGRFYLTRELGRGAVGCVYLAHDPVVGRDLAIKTLNPRLTGAERARHKKHLINEARAAGRLCHPHIVTVHDASDEGDTPYIAMEYLQGHELDRILAEGRIFKADEAAAIGWKLADALAHTHRNQVVHRDVKPANIFLVRDDQPKLVDFGIARAPNRIAESEDEENNDFTMYRPNQPLGTPNYMSPEQAQGKPADERSDIYSLGAVLYEMLTGRKPFEAEDPDELLDRIAYQAPPALYEVRPDVPPLLAQIVTKAMSKRPERRYQDAHQMMLDLKRFLLNERRERRRQSVSAPPQEPDSSPRSGASVSAHSRRLWLLAAVAAIATLSLYLSFWPSAN